MGSGLVILVALAVGVSIFSGKEIGHGVKKASVATFHHVLKPAGCGVKKVATFGQAGCRKAK